MRWIAFLMALICASGLAFAQSPDEVFERFRQAYESHKNFTAQFEQTTLQPSYKTVTQGKLYFAKPNLLRMDYFDKQNPDLLTQSIVLDGKHAWSYTPILNQVNKSVQTQQSGGSGILPGLGASFEHVKEQYTLELVEDEAAAQKRVHRLALSPKQTFEFQEIIEIWIQQSDWLPVQFSYKTVGNLAGDLSVITALKKTKISQPLPEDTFRFVIPEGAEVVKVGPQQ